MVALLVWLRRAARVAARVAPWLLGAAALGGIVVMLVVARPAVASVSYTALVWVTVAAITVAIETRTSADFVLTAPISRLTT